MAASKEANIKATLTGILVDRRNAGPEVTIETENEDGTPGEPIVLHFVPNLPFKAMAGLLTTGAADGFPDFIRECISKKDLELFDSLDITWDGMQSIVEYLTGIYSGNSTTEPS